MIFPPPSKFVPAGNVLAARLSPTPPPFIRKKRYTGRRAEGVRYERKVHSALLELLPDTYVPSPWLHFLAEGEERWRWCQPDGLIVNAERGIITCVEVKYSHTADAWWQIRKLYLPVLAALFPADLWELQAVEVVKWFDPAVRFPEAIEMASELDRPSRKFKVHIFRPGAITHE